jgi:hypothetical protein
MLKIAIGPERTDAPSWNWVGFDTMRELSKYFKVEVFHDEPSECDLAIYVKGPLKNTANRPPRIIYLPIDYFDNPKSIETNADFLKSCTAIGCHCERLMPYLKPYCQDVFFIDHHGMYTLPQINEYKKDGFVLWIGSLEYIAYILKWLEQYPIEHEVRLASNYWSKSGMQKSLELAEKLGLKINMTDTKLNGYRMIYWTQRAQFRAMREAKAALDIKGGQWIFDSDKTLSETSPANVLQDASKPDETISRSAHMRNQLWYQQLKPPTKAQKFVASGIPFAVNEDSYSFEYLKSRGLTPCTPQDQQRWFSEEYWRQITACAAELRRTTTLQYIGLQFKAIIERVAAK